MSFSNKVVLVTGGSSGIGAATAILFAKEGADVAIVGRNETKLQNVAEQCASVGNAPLVIRADVSNDDDAKRIIKETIDKYGKLDILINNAGISRMGCLTDGKLLESFDEINATNLRAVLHLTSLATPHLIATKGSIANVSSVGGQHTPSSPAFTAYCMLKAALNHFTRCAALELAGSGVRVNAVSPGPVETDILENSGTPFPWEVLKAGTALNRVADPQEIAALILFLSGENARGITGSNYVSDNGFLLKN